MDNNNNNSKQVHAAWVRVDMDMLTHTCTVSGEAPSIDTYLAMLAQATRELEAQLRVARVAEIQRAAREQQEVAALTQSLKGKV